MRKSPRLPLEQLAPFLLEVPPLPEGQAADPLDWPKVFGNANPVEVEVGFGKGLFLVSTAPSAPDTNFLGIEIVRKYQLFTANRIAKRNLTNVRLACADARTFFPERIADSSVRAVHVYFPDPWWKKRHHKRRVFTEEFARQCARVLAPGGQLVLATDVEDYAAMVRELMAEQRGLRLLPEAEEARPEGDYRTNYERKARLEGRSVWRLAYDRKDEG